MLFRKKHFSMDFYYAEQEEAQKTAQAEQTKRVHLKAFRLNFCYVSATAFR